MTHRWTALAVGVAIAFASPRALAEDTAPPKTHHGAGPWIVLGVGAGTAAVGVLSFVGAAKAHSDVATESAAKGCTTSPSVVCPAGVDGSNIQTNLDGEHAMNVLGVILTAAGGAAMISGLVWHFLEHGSTVPPATGAALVVTPTLGPNVAMLSLAARF